MKLYVAHAILAATAATTSAHLVTKNEVRNLQLQDCPAVFEPVCGADGSNYSSACVALRAGTTVAFEGSCTTTTRPTLYPVDEGEEFDCNAYEYAPVCGADGVTYNNLLCSIVAGTTAASEGECPVIVTMPTPSPSPTGKPTELPTVNFEYPSGDVDVAYPTDIPGGVLGDTGSPSSASTAGIGTTTVLAVSAFIFVAV